MGTCSQLINNMHLRLSMTLPISSYAFNKNDSLHSYLSAYFYLKHIFLMILCLFFFSSLKHSEHQWTPGFVPFFSSPHLMFFFLTVWQRCYFSHAYLAVSTITAWFFSNHIFSLLLLTSLQPFSAVPPTSLSTSASLFSRLVVTFHTPCFFTLYILMNASTRHVVLNHTERMCVCVCGCACMRIWAHVLRFVSMVRDSAWRTGWRHQRPSEDVFIDEEILSMKREE